MTDLGKMIERLTGVSPAACKAQQMALDRVIGGVSPMPSFPSPYDIRRGEHEELVAATLAAGMTAANGGLETIREVVETYRMMLAELRKPQEGNFGV